MIESICIKKWCLVIGGQREKHQFFHMKLYYWSAFNQAMEVAADFLRFLAFFWSLKNQCLRSVSREKFAGEEVRKKFRPKFPPGGLSMPKPLEYIPWSPRNIFALNLIFYKYILFCLNKCLMRVVSIRNKLTAVEFCFFLSISWLNKLLHHRAAQQVRFLWNKLRRWWRQQWWQDIDDEDNNNYGKDIDWLWGPYL